MIIKKITLSLITTLICLTSFIGVKAEEKKDIEVPLIVKYFGDINPWNFPYSDDYFNVDPNVYNHDLAKASLGLTIASFKLDEENPETNADQIISYFDATGFINKDIDSYYEETSADSVASGIAMKQIDDFTLLAVAICSYGYGKEWAGNVHIGDGERHLGFDIAASTVKQRIEDYIDKYEITGNIKIWISGYSRGSAIANIVAADLTDSNKFKAVYNYNFATPRTTKNKGNYTNIFNIVGIDDVVPTIPFADWGYERYGIDLYTPGQEYDSDFINKANKVTKTYKELLNDNYRSNPSLSDEFRVFFNYLLELLYSDTFYVNSLQEDAMKIFEESSLDNILVLLTSIVETIDVTSDEDKEKVNELINYLDNLTNKYVFQGNEQEINDGSWNENYTITQNLTHEHNVNKYVAWMFSFDDGSFFTNNDSFCHLIIQTDADVEIYDEHGFIESIARDGKTTFSYDDIDNERNIDNPVYLNASRKGSQTIIDIPKDNSYYLLIIPNKNETTKITNVEYSSHYTKAYADKQYSINVTKDIPIYINIDGRESDIISSDDTDIDGFEIINLNQSLSFETLMKLENINVFNLSVGEIAAIIMFSIYAIILAIIVSIILGIIRIIRKKKRSPLLTIVTHTMFSVAFLYFEKLFWYFIPAYPIVHYVFRIIAYMFLFLLASKGLKQNPTKQSKIIYLVFLALVICHFIVLMFVDIKIDNIPSLVLVCLFDIGSIVLAILTWHKRNNMQK